MILEGILTNLSPLTIVAVMLGGILLGLYFAALNKYKRPAQLLAGVVSFLVIGYSFYIPFMFAATAEGSGNPLRFIGSMILWTLFTFSATASNLLAAKLAETARK